MQQRPSTTEEYQKRINIVVEYINNHLSEDIDISILAEMSNFSPYHFHRIMRAFLKEPIGAFIVRMRAETAARLLRNTDIPIREIAYRVGYDMPSSLSKVFKQFYGFSPSEYRINKNYTIMKAEVINPELKISVEVKEQSSKKIIYVRLAGAYNGLDYCNAWERLWTYIKENNLFGPEIEHLCIYHDDPKVTEANKLRTDVCLTVSKPAQPKGEVGVKELPGGKYAVFRYVGSYDNLHSVYDTIYGKWIPEHGYRIAEFPGYEKYLNHPANTKPEDLITEVYIPIE